MAKLHKRQGVSPDGRAWAFTMGGDQKFADLFEEIFTEKSDRTTVIISHAYIEHLLQQLLEEFLVDDKDIRENILDPNKNGPLSTFSAKANMAYLLGLLSKDTSDKLKTMARIRNVFAHNFEFRSFTDLVDKDSKAKKGILRLKRDIDLLFGYNVSSDPPDEMAEFRSRYEGLFILMQAEILVAISVAHQERRRKLEQSRTQITRGSVPN